jgi:predicted nuclease of restriction endonuclease-like (RecB) superfamily
MSELITDNTYRDLLHDIKEKIKVARIKAMVAVNHHLVSLYWDIGQTILEKQSVAKWGDKVLKQLATDLKHEFPDMEGCSTTNLKYMRQFARAYPQFPIGQVPLDQITWYHNITLLQKVPDENARFWYAAAAIEYGWSRDMMVHQIETKHSIKFTTHSTPPNKPLPAP